MSRLTDADVAALSDTDESCGCGGIGEATFVVVERIVTEARADERARCAQEIEAYADSEADRTGWDGMAGMLGNWVGGIQDGARIVREGAGS